MLIVQDFFLLDKKAENIKIGLGPGTGTGGGGKGGGALVNNIKIPQLNM